MSYVKWKITHTPFANNGWDSLEETEITDFYSPLARYNLGDNKDNFSFNVVNFNGQYDGFFNPLDRIVVSRVANSTTVTTDDIKMTTIVQPQSNEVNGSKNNIKVNCYNFSEALSSAIVFIDTINKTAPEIIKEALANAGSINSNFKVEWDSGNDTAIAGLTFSTIPEERSFNKTLLSIIEKYSTNEFNDDGYSFYWYVNSENKFVWRPQLDSVDDTFNATTEEHTSFKHSVDTSGIKNVIIAKGGSDPAGRQIQVRYTNWSSVAKYGNKYYFLTEQNTIAKELVDQDIVRDFGTDQSDDGFPNITSSAYVTTWASNYSYTTKNYGVVANLTTVTIDEGSESSNRKAYVELIREETKKRLYDAAKRFADSRQFGKLKVDLEFKAGSKTWGLGDVISVTIPVLGFTSKRMRVVDIQLANSQDTYSLEEDVGSV